MATYTRREVVTRTIEYAVPAELPYGAHVDEIGKAIGNAVSERRNIENEGGCAGDIWVRAGEEEIIVAFERKES